MCHLMGPSGTCKPETERWGETVTGSTGTVRRVGGGGGVVGWPGVGSVDAQLRHLLLQGGHDAPGGALETALQRTAQGGGISYYCSS